MNEQKKNRAENGPFIKSLLFLVEKDIYCRRHE